MKAKIKDGLVETEQVAELHAPRIAWFYDHTGDADFHQGRIRLVITQDGNAKGLIGGYRSWREIYAENTFAQDGGQQGIREHEDGVALYYALKRNADGMTDPNTGQNMGISTAYRITAAPAYVVDPAKPAEVTVLTAEEPRRRAYLAIQAAMIKATTTRIVQPVPPGTTEASVPALEKIIVDLPSKDFFLQTLDRPHYVNPVDDFGNEVNPTKPQRQVSNDTPVYGSAPGVGLGPTINVDDLTASASVGSAVLGIALRAKPRNNITGNLALLFKAIRAGLRLLKDIGWRKTGIRITSGPNNFHKFACAVSACHSKSAIHEHWVAFHACEPK